MFNLFQTYKKNFLKEVIPVGRYATTARRKTLNFAAKVVKTKREIFLNVTRIVMENLQLVILWQ